MNSLRNSFEMVVCSRFIILQSVVTRYLFVQKVVNCCSEGKQSVNDYIDFKYMDEMKKSKIKDESAG